ncbi:hypothetical protein A3SI_19671 [Nitritalea halalkaliphila LW7]|uniref:Uncharacterized protein n=2 Tax=Nitritalea TaxID=1187887 RepID=I5BSM4_9BACT|nr:hypothetical protein A3SI_19671 [Nitritalea halalkaliphila LW7]
MVAGQSKNAKVIARIDHKELKDKLDIPFRDLFLNRNPQNKNAKFKYEHEKVKKKGLRHKFTTFIETVDTRAGGKVSITMASVDDTGRDGILVFTGQPGKREENQNNKSW